MIVLVALAPTFPNYYAGSIMGSGLRANEYITVVCFADLD
jgi:hypothetical protein